MSNVKSQIKLPKDRCFYFPALIYLVFPGTVILEKKTSSGLNYFGGDKNREIL